MNHFITSSTYLLAAVLWQAESFDWIGKVAAPALAAFATIFTIVTQQKAAKAKAKEKAAREQLESEIKQASIKQEASDKVLARWERFTERQDEELAEIRKRLNYQEVHTKICERGQMKLAAQLLKHGIEVDLDAILGDLTMAEKILAADTHISGPPHDTE